MIASIRLVKPLARDPSARSFAWAGGAADGPLPKPLHHHPAQRRMLPVLHLDPTVEPAASIRALPGLAHQPLQPHQAGMPKRPAQTVPCGCHPAAVPVALQGWSFSCSAAAGERPCRQRPGSQGIVLNLIIVLTAVQAIEVRRAVDAQQHRLAVEHERAVPVAQLRQRPAGSDRSNRGRCG